MVEIGTYILRPRVGLGRVAGDMVIDNIVEPVASRVMPVRNLSYSLPTWISRSQLKHTQHRSIYNRGDPGYDECVALEMAGRMSEHGVVENFDELAQRIVTGGNEK